MGYERTPLDLEQAERVLRKEGLKPGTREYNQRFHEQFELHDAAENLVVERANWISHRSGIDVL